LFSGGDEKQVIEDKLIDMEEFSKDEILQLEKELLGFYLTEHPLKNKIDQLADVITHKTYQVKEKTSGKVKLAGIISNKRIVTTRKSGKEMAFVNLEDETGKAELVVFPSIFEKSKNLLKGDRLVLVTAKVDMRENEQSLIAEKIVDAKRFFNKNKDSKQEDKFDFHLKIPKGTNQNTLVKLNTILRKNQGEDNGVLEFPNGRDVKLSFGVSWTDKLKEKIEKLFNI